MLYHRVDHPDHPFQTWQALNTMAEAYYKVPQELRPTKADQFPEEQRKTWEKRGKHKNNDVETAHRSFLSWILS